MSNSSLNQVIGSFNCSGLVSCCVLFCFVGITHLLSPNAIFKVEIGFSSQLEKDMKKKGKKKGRRSKIIIINCQWFFF
jgi:hypothetical protein